mmetsp:Transcript_391/g.467  ORF Transcript_391/g.467 Transcript_391/m.467 type:complete len:102 (+) Transcript_391:1395-1700(+)
MNRTIVTLHEQNKVIKWQGSCTTRNAICAAEGAIGQYTHKQTMLIETPRKQLCPEVAVSLQNQLRLQKAQTGQVAVQPPVLVRFQYLIVAGTNPLDSEQSG